MPFRLLFALIALKCLTVSAQEDYSALSIPKEFTENANAVIRLHQTNISIPQRDKMVIENKLVVTILNEYGMQYFDAGESFSKTQQIKDIEAVVYNSAGQQLKKFKKKDFREHSLSSGAYIVDDKYLGLDYTPAQYPVTLVYTSQIETINTAFIPQWSPFYGTFASTQSSEINITVAPELGLKYKDYNFGNVVLNKQQNGNTLTLKAENITALRKEDYSPALYKIKPYVLFGLEKFHLEGEDGEAHSWEAFGKWMYANLLTGLDEVSVETQNKIKALVGTETDPLKKAAIVYKYVQSKTRYVLIALGIGGWKPMPAKDVDRLGYGDCKALSNYTRALLKVVGVDSYYTVVYGNEDRRDLKQDFVSMQGNHIILAIPNNGTITWLECTSQVAPFGFQGDFTDNRLALLVKPEGGEIVRTHIYNTEGNSQQSIGKYSIAESGAINGEVHIMSKGLQYGNRYYYEYRSADDLDKMYKNRFSNINNLKISQKQLQNDADNHLLKEDVFIEAESYCSKSGGRLIFAVNAFNQLSNVPQRYRNRKLPLEISTGIFDSDEIVISLPEGYTIEATPGNAKVMGKFGEYNAEYEVKENNILYKRTLLLKEGLYANTEYEEYRQFIENIARNDAAKIVLVKK